MTTLIRALNGLASRWAEIAWAVSWQAVVVLAAAAVVARLMRRSPPALRYWLWQVAAAKLLLMTLWGTSIPLPVQVGYGLGLRQEELPPRSDHIPTAERLVDRLSRIGESTVGDGGPSGPRGHLSEPVGWRTWIFMGWGAAVILQVAAIVNQRRRLLSALDRTVKVEDPALRSLVGELSRRVGLSAPPRLLFTTDMGSPFVCDPIHPALVLPKDLVSSLPLESLTSVLLHELSHIKRRDLVWDWIPTITRVLYAFHPAAQYIAFRARLERELACDQAAMVFTGQGAAGYASTLVDVVCRSSRLPAIRPAATLPSRDHLMTPDSIPS